MPNQVQVDFVANPAQLFNTADQVKAKLVQVTNQAPLMEQAFSKTISNVQKQASNLNFALRQISDNFSGGISQASLRAQAALAGTQSRLRQIEAQAAVTRDPLILKNLQAEAVQASADLDRLEAKIKRVASVRGGDAAGGTGLSRQASAGRLNLARQGADVFTQLGSGQDLSLIAIQQGPQILDAAAQSGFKLEAAWKGIVRFASQYAGILTVAAAGAAVVYKITTDIAAQEERKLKFIENGAIASNKVLLSIKAQAEEFAKQRATAQFNRDLQKDLANDSAADLQRKIKLNQELIRLTPLSPNNPQRQQTILEAESQLDKVRADNAKKLDETFAQRHADFIARQKAEAEFERQQQRERIERADKLRDQYRSVFDSLRDRINADNPFARILTEDARAVENLKKQLQGATPELIKFAEGQQKTLTAAALFATKADSLIAVSDLKQQSQFFRNGQRGESADDLLRRLGFNPSQFQKFSDQQKQNLASQFGTRQAVSLGNASVGGRLGGVNIADLAIGAFQNAQQRQGNEETVQQRLDRQLSELKNLSPQDKLQRESLDRKIVSLASGVDPTQLRQDTRNQVADALDRNAERVARQQGEAVTALQENTAILKQLTDLYNKQVQGGGTVGGANEVKISIDNNSGGTATTDITSPNPRDTVIGFNGTD